MFLQHVHDSAKVVAKIILIFLGQNWFWPIFYCTGKKLLCCSSYCY